MASRQARLLPPNSASGLLVAGFFFVTLLFSDADSWSQGRMGRRLVAADTPGSRIRSRQSRLGLRGCGDNGASQNHRMTISGSSGFDTSSPIAVAEDVPRHRPFVRAWIERSDSYKVARLLQVRSQQSCLLHVICTLDGTFVATFDANQKQSWRIVSVQRGESSIS